MDTVFVVLLVVGVVSVAVTKLHPIVGIPRHLPLWFQIGSVVVLGAGILLGWMLGKIEGGGLVLVGAVVVIGIIAAVREFRLRDADHMNRPFWWKE